MPGFVSPAPLRAPALSWREPPEPPPFADRAGFRFGARGSHSSRTIMLAELRELFDTLPEDANQTAYTEAVVSDNALGKATAASRHHSRQHLRELYGCDPRIPIFRVLRRLWGLDEPGRPLLALLAALARDPVLRATAPAVVPLPIGAELVRSTFIEIIRSGTGDRFKEAVLDKIARNAASSWSQSGHLHGRVRKLRQRAAPTPGPLAFAVWLGEQEGRGGRALLESRWTEVLDAGGSGLVEVAGRARTLGLLELRAGGGVFEVSAAALDPRRRRR